jgi:dynein heavy chain
MNLHQVPVQILKIFQLFETFQVRFGVMLVGFTNCGKTTVFEILKHAMTQLAKRENPDPKFQAV